MNEQLCPLCGQANQCTQADPRTAHQPCWCFAARIPPAVLQRLPEALRDRQCLCPNCAQVALEHVPSAESPA